MKKWIKLTAWLLALVLTLQTTPVPAAAAVREPLRTEHTEPVPTEPVPTEPPLTPQAMQPPVQPADVASDFAWTLEDGVLTISGNGDMPNWVLYDAPWNVWRREITSVIVEHGITSLGNYAFYKCTSLVSVELPDSMTTIGAYAFSGCTSLTGIELPDSLTTIDNAAFSECTSLTGIELPDSLTYIGGSVFYECESLTGIEIPDGVTEICAYAFQNCSALASIRLPDSLTTIGALAFYDCSALTSVELPDTVTTIGSRAFYYCTSLTEIKLSENLASIGSDAFYGCMSLTGIEIPVGVTEINSNTFRNCYALASVTLPENLTAIGEQAFRSCTSLRKVTLPQGVVTIGQNAFRDCTALTDLTLSSSLTLISLYAFQDCTSLVSVELPDSLTSIGAYAFSGCTSLTGIELPDGLTEIERNTFSGCSALASVTIPDSMTTIGNHAFNSCISLTGIGLPDSVTSIGDSAFYNCTALTGIELPERLTAIADCTFYGCSALASAEIPDSVTSIGSYVFSNCKSLASIELPKELTSIGSYAFYGCTSLTGIKLPEGLTAIASSSFSGCSALASAEIPDGVTTIGGYAFDECTSLTRIRLPNSMTTIGDGAFFGCTSLTGIKLPDCLTDLGEYAFYNCKQLAQVELSDSLTAIEQYTFHSCPLTGIEIPDGVTSIGKGAFQYCTSLTSAVLPDGLTTLGDYAFENCSALALSELPDSLTTLGWKAFKNCSALTLSKLPDSLTSISESVFYNCDGLTVTEIPTGVTRIPGYLFYDCDSLTEIIVPEGVTEIGVYSFYDCDSLKKVELPVSVEEIHDWAFTGSSVTIYGFTGSYAAQFAGEQGYPFVSLDHVPVVRLCLKDAGGAVIEDGYRLEWYQGDTLIGSGDTLQVQESGCTYTCRIILEDELLTRFYPPEDITFETNGEDMTLECVLRGIPRLTLSGRILGDDKTGIPGTVQITQNFHGTVTQTCTLTAAGDGSFSAEVAAVHTTLRFQAEGFRDRSLPLTLTGLTQDYPLGDVQLMKLPDARVMLQLRREDAVRPGAAASRTRLPDFEGWSFTVYNVTQNAAITDFTVQYPDLIPAEGLANPGDILRIGAENAASGIVCEPVELQLNELAAGNCVLSFLQAGSFVLDDIQARKQSRVLIFDTAGVLVAEDLAYRGWRSMDLAAGAYQVVLLEVTELLGGVPELAVLDAYGLTEGQDYTKLDVTVEDGSITVIDQVTVPILNESRLFYTDPTKTNISLNTNATFVGKYVLLRMEYAIREEYDTENEMVSIQLPEGIQAVGGSLTVDNRKTPFTVEDGTVRVLVDQPQAILRLYLLGQENGSFPVDARLSFDLDGNPLVQPLGTAELELSVANMKLPERTSFSELIVSGTAVPYSTLTIYSGDTPLKTVTSNGAGSWQAEVVLDNPYSYVYHAISVGVTHANLPQEVRSEPQLVIYDSTYVEPVKVTMHHGRSTTVFDFRNPTADPYYTFHGTYYTFVVELNRNDDPLIERVYVVTSNGRKLTYIECVYDSTKNAWIGTHQYSNSSEVPTGLDVRITMKESDAPPIDEELFEDISNTLGELEDQIDKEMEAEKQQIIKDIILPNLDEMTIEQVIDYIKDVQKDTDSLMEDVQNEEKSQMEAQGIYIEEHENGTRVSNGDKGINYREEVLEEVDEEELIRSHYTPVKLPDGDTKYIYAEGSSVVYVDPSNRYRFLVELENYTGESVSFSDPATLLQFRSIADNAVQIKYGKWDVSEDFYREMWKQTLVNQHSTQKSLESVGKKLRTLQDSNADPKLIQQLQDEYDTLLRRNAFQQQELDRFNKKLKQCRVADEFGKACGVASTILSAKNLYDTVNKGSALKNLHRSLYDTCKDDADYQRLSNEIDVLSTCMNISASAGLVIDGVSLAAAFLNAPIGIGIEITGLIFQKSAEFAHNSEYNKIANELKSLECANLLEELALNKGLIVDPSGYVYEAVPSNRLEGVKAEVYYQGYPLDEYGVPGEELVDILWDAENYDQVNPQYTDAEGRYHWDVPFGLWLVKYSKEGYLDADSKDDPAANEDGYLPVPPPQLEVNVGMVSTAAPEVESLNVYQDQIQIIFSQYMKLDRIRLTVVSGGKTIDGRLEPANAEFNEEQTEQFATIFNFIPAAELCGTATVTIAGAVNYAGTEMSAAHTQTKDVTIRPTSVSLVQETTLLYGDTLELEVRVLPAAAGANKPLTVTSAAPGLVDVAEQTVTTDGNGIATVTVIGSLPTSAEVTVRLNGTELESAALIHVKLPQPGVCEKVTASIPSGTTVDAGTELELFTGTEGAQIYYTLDGTCPCVVDSPSRILYTGPIVLTEDAFIIAYAVKEGFEDSATAGFMYTIKQGPVNPFEDVAEGSFYYDPVMWAIENGITNGTSATTFGPNDQCMRAHVVTFLWRAVGSPEPTRTDNPFVDVKPSDFYYKPVLWALENGITSGMDATHFGPTSYCNRAQVVTFLYRTMGSPELESAENPFTDVAKGSFYEKPVLWAVKNGITNGLSATTFGPSTICNRAQIVTFLYRAFVD